MASVSTAPRAPLPAAASSSLSARQVDPNPSGSHFLDGRRLRVVRRLAGAAPSRRAPLVCCSARSPDADAGDERRRRGWDAMLHDAFKGAVRRWSEYVSNYWPPPTSVKEAGTGKRVGRSHEEEVMNGDEEERKVGEEEGKWSWARWKRHFALIEESGRLVDELQLQLQAAVYREDYRTAHKLRLAIAATSKNDAVGRAISDLNMAIDEERYKDAAYIRDHAGAGLLGWWSGISGNLSDPYGLIIRISAEHGRYVARSYDTRQLASDSPGLPIFEIYFAEANGGYNLQAVHLKPDGSDSDQVPNMLREKLGIDSINISSSPLGSKHEEFDGSVNMDDKDSDDSNIAAGPGSKNLSSDLTAVPRIKILKVVPMQNVDHDYIINIFDQISEEDDDNDDHEVENESSEDVDNDDNSGVAETVSAEENGDESGDESDIETLVSFDFVSENNVYASRPSAEAFERMPARLEKRDRFSFSFYTEEYSKKLDAGKARQTSKETVGLHADQQDYDGFVQLDRVKLSGSNKKLSILQLGIKQNNKVQQKLHGVTHFSRIQMPIFSDPLTGLYVTTSGFDSEILSLQRKFGQWRDDGSSEEHSDLLFYEHVEAVKLTGDNLMPAGQVVFRAKVGERYQLPHKGIIPRELGVIARYKGQRKIADPGFQNPRWVDGELLIIDGKFIRDGPVIAFFYWTSNFHRFEFFRRLRLPE
ncbi:protein EXECUTER 1, chloroplastic [Zea mays]|uniref:Protein EXECUTER 1 chloroplastic n=2 Tax=Zea mays TaxID=4577 RepID=A0A096R6U6_MAIZE|nr:protein EXECUTER 1, chloroplastic [Zea mays]XP_008664852.1 protein EXECUTER 1, chloroplastic [Zea mays]XP_008664853.1 protein EXECUTER 1, chloroplastic [Zea mays]XP_008664854.1 protein EXECUTER 1, chloroplastic [Zea mays]XP_020402343.1 protein EXECUTER 1, chloroplastic [Zea mays]ONM05652.1 Protein EXECUTER 1 chloroplastic [Zea mays]ONM05656.1 Protein EXECUTER 1 chloroplastic [Zea mays]ONM05657.1 Protein EXECUTER 1 chloroplastic [Zea mays]ONM05658.1 Protein EXECUTER 1 chloroplastic [Zea m|eukprot:XP_008664851.1 protein EXECUTER 1, chloroplastic [Zea mays]